MRVKGIEWAGVIAKNYAASRDFLSEKLGLSLDFEAKKHVISHFRFPSGQLLELHGPSNRQRRYEKFRWFDGYALGFEVDNLEAAHQEMLGRGVHFIHGIERWKKEAWSLFLGPQDRLFQIQQTTPHSPESTENSAKLLGFSWAGVAFPDFDGAIQFFSHVMEMPLARRDDSEESAQFWLPDGHLFEVFGPNHAWNKLMEQVTLGFYVEDVKQVRAELQEVGVDFVTDSETTSFGHEFAFFRDLDNYLYALWKPGGWVP